MRVLGIETATRRASVALWENGVATAHAQADHPMQHAERMIALVDEAFGEAGWPKASIDLVACGVGPGSFTGVRVGIATAKGIALGLSRPIVGVSSLEAMARAYQSPADALVCLIDAKKGEVFLAAYGSGGNIEIAPTHLALGRVAAAIARFAAMRAVVLGEVADGIDLGAFAVHRDPATDLPDAATVAGLGARRMAEHGPSDLHALEPAYVRPPDITAPRAGGGGGTL